MMIPDHPARYNKKFSHHHILQSGFDDDIDALKVFDQFAQTIENINRDLKHLLLDDDLRQEFCSIDATILRAVARTVAAIVFTDLQRSPSAFERMVVG